MGQCGCGDYQGEFQFPGPGGSIYSLEVYPGCDYCDQGPGIVIHRHVSEDGKVNWGVREQFALPFREFGDGDGEAAVPILDLDAFRGAVRDASDDLDIDRQGELKHELTRALSDVVIGTLGEFRVSVLPDNFDPERDPLPGDSVPPKRCPYYTSRHKLGGDGYCSHCRPRTVDVTDDELRAAPAGLEERIRDQQARRVQEDLDG